MQMQGGSKLWATPTSVYHSAHPERRHGLSSFPRTGGWGVNGKVPPTGVGGTTQHGTSPRRPASQRHETRASWRPKGLVGGAAPFDKYMSDISLPLTRASASHRGDLGNSPGQLSMRQWTTEISLADIKVSLQHARDMLLQSCLIAGFRIVA